MKITLGLLVACLLATSALAAQPPWSNRLDIRSTIMEKRLQVGGPPTSFRSALGGGEDIPNAVVISSLPFDDTGNTCGALDDYDATCPYSGSTSPDLVYAYTPAADEVVAVDLCASQYDTKVYVFDGSPATIVACSDDAGCGSTGWQSKIVGLALVAGHTYYVVVDGYGGLCGDYAVAITSNAACQRTVACSGVDQVENEPVCFDGYVDTFDGGCNSSPPVFLPVTCGTICGTSGTYVVGSNEYRDTDWYELTVGEGAFTWTGVSSGFDLQMYLLNGTCDATNILDSAVSTNCVPATIAFNGPGSFWLWAGPTTFTGLACGMEYRLDIVGPGITPCDSATPARRSTWGALKLLYR